jgi:hypothetical protein
MLSASPPHIRFIEWAGEQFAEEIRTDFRQAGTFDGLSSACFLKAIRAQPQEALNVLKQVLPLGVGFGRPEDLEQRSQLPEHENSAVEKYLDTLARTEREDFWSRVPDLITTRSTKEFRLELREARRVLGALTKDFAKQWGCSRERGAPGEWGFIRKGPWGELVLSLFLMQTLELTYLIKVWDQAGVLLCPGNHYLSRIHAVGS